MPSVTCCRLTHFFAAITQLACSVLGLAACHSIPPPKSTIPTAEAAIKRMQATTICGQNIQAKAKIDQFTSKGRVRADVFIFAGRPANLRMDASIFGVNVMSLTSHYADFRLLDLRNKTYYFGPAKPCNLARVIGVPITGQALVGLLMGQAAILPPLREDKLEAPGDSISWSSAGYYVVKRQSFSNLEETLFLGPYPDDYKKHWTNQRLRTLYVEVKQSGNRLYQAELEGYTSTKMSAPRIDPDGVDAPIAPSGPHCEAELPRTIHLEVMKDEQDVLFRYDEVNWNPPLPPGVFTQTPPSDLPNIEVDCKTPD